MVYRYWLWSGRVSQVAYEQMVKLNYSQLLLGEQMSRLCCWLKAQGHGTFDAGRVFWLVWQRRQ